MSDKSTKPVSKTKGDDAFTAKDTAEAFNRKWAAPLLLGPFIPAVFSIIVIIGGNITLNSNVGICGYPLKDFLSGSIVLSYVFLILYSWVYLGDNYSLYIPFLGKEVTILKPITSLRFLSWMYLLLALFSCICWGIGSFYLAQSIFCITTAPRLYSFTLFVIVSYWIGFFTIVFYIFKLMFGRKIAASLVDGVRAPTDQELEEQIFRKAFQKLDMRKRNRIKTTDLSKLFTEVGVYVADEDVKDLEQQLDPSDSGEIEFYVLLKWFKVYQQESAKYENESANDNPSAPNKRTGENEKKE